MNSNKSQAAEHGVNDITEFDDMDAQSLPTVRSVSSTDITLSTSQHGKDYATSLGTMTPNPDSTHQDYCPPTARRYKALQRIENRNILLLCLLVTVPMVAFTVTVLFLVFGYKIDDMKCAYQELCSKEGLSNGTNTMDNYYVDFPAARLVFISSWSSTISFSLVATLMAMYSYVAASKFIQLSASNSIHPLPTTYQTSILLRILNAEFLTFYSLVYHKLKEVFQMRRPKHDTSAQTQIVRFSILVLTICLSASLFIQFADTYMHVATEAVEIVQALAQPSPNYGYSRGLAPWCLNRPTFGSLNNSNFWSCGMIAAREPTLTYVTTSNYSLLSSVALGASDVHNILDFVDTDGIPIAILAPNNVPAGIDYYASTYGVSTQCQLVRNSSCTIRPGKITDTKVPMAGFNCSDDGVDLDVSGNIYPVATQAYEFNFHRFINEPPPFASGATSYQFKEDLLDMAANLSDSEAPTVFKNPFRLLVAMNIFSDAARTMDLSDSDNRRFVILDVDFLMPICNSTVWDVNYAVVDSKITNVTRTLSNGTVAGIASMTMSQMFGKSDLLLEYARTVSSTVAKSVDDFAQTFSRTMAHQYLGPIASQTSPRSALLVQTRNSRIVSKVPKSALWILVTANLLYIILAITLAILAFLVTSMDVYQLRTRLNVTGLAAQLFEGPHAERKVRNDKDLFETPNRVESGLNRVRVYRTETGGTSFEIVKV